MRAGTSSRATAIADFVVGAGAAGGTVVAALRGDDPDNDADMRVVAPVLIVGFALPFLLSARHGVRATRRCRAQEAAFADYLRREAARPQHRGRAGAACRPDETCDPGLACIEYQCRPAGSSE